MIATPHTLRKLWLLFAIGILVFDGILLLTGSPTITQAVIAGPAWFQIVLCAAMAYLMLHFWTDLVP